MKRPRKLIDTVCIVAVGAALAAVAGLNMFQPKRATVSESEKRALAAFPVFSSTALADGSFFAGIDAFVTDAFPARETLMRVSGQIKTLYGGFLADPMTDVTVLNVGGDTSVVEADLPELTLPSDSAASGTEQEIVVTKPENADGTSSESQGTESAQPESITLSAATLHLSIGDEPIKLSADIGPDGFADATVAWINSAPRVIGIEVMNDHLLVSGLTAGNAVLIATCGELTAACQVTVSDSIPAGEPEQPGTSPTIPDEPEFLTSGLIIYGDAVYSIPYLNEHNGRNYAATMDYFAELFPDAQVSTLIAPLASAMLDPDTFGNRLTDQNAMIDTLNSYCKGDVNCVNAFNNLWTHRDEYLYFKTDHHWTQLGAYYAYQSFVESVGLEATPLSEFEFVTLNDDFHGTMNGYTNNDPRVARITDAIYAYLPTKANTMTLRINGQDTTFDSCIQTRYHNYGAFILADNAYTVINVPENPQDRNILVYKDSYGNALVPFLAENYGNIIVVDPRYADFNVYERLKDYPLRDILFCNNIYNPNTSGWYLKLLRTVGIYD